MWLLCTLERVCTSLQSAGFSVVSRAVPAGEQHKTLTTLAQLLEFLAEEHLTRTDCVAALGGGVIGDMAGLLRAVYLPGFPAYSCPPRCSPPWIPPWAAKPPWI